MEKSFLSGNYMKAGVPELDREKIDEIIMDASKGSQYYQHQQRRMRQVAERAQSLSESISDLSLEQLAKASREIQEFIDTLTESRRDDKVYVHMDMDSFYAAVEEKHRPELREVPMAVGDGNMLCTANYPARKFGVSSAMPGFIARRLCPQLVIIPPNFRRYAEESEQVHTIFKEYDSGFLSISLDEASLDLSRCCNKDTVEATTQELRGKVREATGLTCSAGIGPTRQLAKMASNVNKPDGQFCLFSQIGANLLSWLHEQPAKKISGVGRVTAALLEQALGIKSIGDLWREKEKIWLCFRPKQAEHLISAAYGLSPSMYDSLGDAEDVSRKSLSVNRTYYPPLRGISVMDKRLRELCDSLSRDLETRQFGCCCVTLMIKTADFSVSTRSITVKHRVETVQELFKLASALLHKSVPENAKLLGVKASALESTKPTALDYFLKNSAAIDDTGSGEEALVACPVCSKQILERHINQHLDSCLPLERQPKKLKRKGGPMDSFVINK